MCTYSQLIFAGQVKFREGLCEIYAGCAGGTESREIMQETTAENVSK